VNLKTEFQEIQNAVESCRYNIALFNIVSVLNATNRYLDDCKPWTVVKTDKAAAQVSLFNAVQYLRIASILLKPFIPQAAKTIYASFNFPKPWDEVRFEDAAELKAQPDDLRVTAELVDGKVKPLFPRID
jgi:methionyl-tRNA synthetase